MTRPSFGVRLYRWVLRCYPREFRDEYGGEMTALYHDRARDEGALRLWIALTADLFRTAPREQLNVLAQDVRQTLRLFVRTPLVTATALLTVALGLAGSTAVFSVVHGVILRPLPYPHPDRLIELFEDNRQANMVGFRASALNYLSWAERATSTEALAAFAGNDLTLTDHGEPERLAGSAITSSMFSVLGVSPVVGRALHPDDERPGSRRVVVLAESLWRRRFGGTVAIVGQSITLNGERYEVIGIVPPAFRDVGRSRASSIAAPQIFVPLVIDPAREHRGNHVLRAVGRLRPGITLDRAQDEMSRIAAAMEQEFPATNKGWRVRLVKLHDTMLDERVRPSLLVLLGAMGMVLLIACANVANVLLARSLDRQRELALRAALGAGRSRLVRQLVTESFCLALTSGACGLVLALFTVRTLRVMLPPTLPRSDEIGIDATVLAVGVILSLASGVLMGWMPAMRASRAAVVPLLAHQGRGLAGGTRMRVRHGIVVAQMALATLLLVGAALLLQSFVRLQHVHLGFDPKGVITTRVSLPGSGYPDGTRAADFYRRLLESFDGIAQIQVSAVGTSAPFAPGVRAGGQARDPARAPIFPDTWIPAVEHIVSADYLRTLAIPLLAGRSFGVQDGPGAPQVAVVSESVARQLWPDGSAIGRTLDWNGNRQFEVIGVVGSVRGSSGQGARGGSLDRAPTDAVYLSATQFPQRTMTVVLRAAGEPAALAPAIARAVHDIDPRLPVAEVRSLSDWLADSAAQPRFTTILCGLLAVIALLLAAVGVYGVLSYSVAWRTHEIGVRMAIGAPRGRILRLVMRDGMATALVGIALGLLGAFSVSRVLATLLFDVSARDSITYGVVAVVLAAVALLACGIPAARATRIDPLIALRTD